MNLTLGAGDEQNGRALLAGAGEAYAEASVGKGARGAVSVLFSPMVETRVNLVVTQSSLPVNGDVFDPPPPGNTF